MSKEAEKIYTTGDVLRMFGIPYYKLAYWFETKRLPPARRTANGKRIYTEEDIEVLRERISELVGDVSGNCRDCKTQERRQYNESSVQFD